MKSVIFAIIPFLLAGCVNKCGISDRYYSDCREYYDGMGVYHRDCPENLIQWCKERKNTTTGPCLNCQ